MTHKPCKGPRLGVRHLQSFLLFLGLTVMHIARLNVSVAIVAMTNAATTNPNFPEYEWTLKQKSYILSSFYWGYILTLCPGSFLCRRYGAKVVLFVASCGTAVFSLMTPWCITWGGWQVFCAIRILQGLFQGVIFPCVTEHLAMWSPPEERNRLGAFSYTGTDCGTVLAMFISGMIAKGAMGWPGISYVSGALCAAWCFLWLIFASNNATESRFIGEAECKYIESSLEHNEDFHDRTIPIPWKAIWTSVPFLALLVTRCAETYGLSTLQAEIPSYMNGVLNMEIQSNAVFSSLPFLAMWLLSYVYLIAADVLLKKKILSLTSVRKLFNTLSFWIPAAALIGIGFLSEENKNLAIVLMTVSVGVNSGATIGSSLNSIDLSPNHAGILIGLSNTVANVIPILTPLIAGEIVADKVSQASKKNDGKSQIENNNKYMYFPISQHNRGQWQIVFGLAAVIFFLGNVVFIIWGTAKAQPWDADDFLKPKDAESACQKSKSIVAEVAPPIDPVLEQQISWPERYTAKAIE
ncbi:putative inorganic phosphate cotransporter isoform X1 [Drosophila santomea]|uniref:putative inorganic phosphate cotransporter isoform X1 n=1 Tax=Drosophila santomea TaxID=129105 RepID=UPI001954B767|nr:putative inorganic phosphate cotransporter isoform X1 [Drosophila santomea]